MNVQVAASARLEKSDRPQMPWPLVQPEPRMVPTPTMRPPAIIVSGPPANVIEAVSKKNSPDEDRAYQHADNENQPPVEFRVEF